MIHDRKKLIIFDFDGTLVDSLPLWMDLHKKVLAKRGLYPSEKEIINVSFYHTRPLKELGIIDEEKFIHEKMTLAAKTTYRAPLFDDVKEIVVKLKKRGFKIAIATSSEDKKTKKALVHTHLVDHIDYVVSGDQVTNRKPHLESLHAILAHFDMRPSDAIFVGDALVDLEAARAADIEFVWCEYEQSAKYILPLDHDTLTTGSSIKIKSISELLIHL